jgi:hypothetical protein
LKSPTTLTLLAWGAQTAKRTPGTSPTGMMWGAKLVIGTEVPAFAEALEIEIPQDRQDAVFRTGTTRFRYRARSRSMNLLPERHGFHANGHDFSKHPRS